MAKFNFGQTKFNAGIYDELVDGFRDAPKREHSIRGSSNMIPMVQGGLIRRGGTKHLYEVKDSTKNTFLYRFKFNETQSYVLEFGDNYIRFIKDRIQIEASPSVPYEVITTYSHLDFFATDNTLKFQFRQSADVIYIVHPNYPPRVLARIADTNWTINDIGWFEQPYIDINTTDTTLTASAGTGSVTLTASSILGINGNAGFKLSDVGRMIRVRGNTGNSWGWGTVTAFINSLSVTILHDPDSQPFILSATKDWRLAAFSSDEGYPSVIGLYNERLILAGASATPDRVFLSAVAGYSAEKFDFSPTAKDGVAAPDDAIFTRVQDGEINVVEWVSHNRNGLLVGTSDNEWVIRAATTNSKLANDNIQVDLVTSRGSASIPAVSNGFANIFIQQSRSRAHEIAYSFEVDGFRSPDVSLFFVNSMRDRATAMEWNQEPDNIFYFITDTGILHALTYMREEGVIAWGKHSIAKGKVLSMTSVPSPSIDRDDLYMIVERTINGSTVKYIEYMTPYVRDGDLRKDLIYADSAFIYDSVITDTVIGIDHLEGETVGVLVDGKTHPDQVVTGGSITLSNNVTGSKIIIGLKYTWHVILHDPVTQTQDGSMHGKMRNVTQMIIRLWKTLGIRYGADGEALDEITLGYGLVFNNAIDLFTGDTEPIEYPEGNNRKTHVRLEHDGLLPACILGIRYRIKVQDR